jgi:acetate---CoA ligase (ADP-forming)
VLEGTHSGLVALRHLLTLADRAAVRESVHLDEPRRSRWSARLDEARPLDGMESFALIADYGIAATPLRSVTSAAEAVRAAREVGYPVVLKTDDPSVPHKTEVGGVLLGIADDSAVAAAYDDLATRLGSRVLVCAAADSGTELSVGLVRDPQLGPLVIVAAGGTLAELLNDRAVALPPLSPERADNLVRRLRVDALLDGWRGAKPSDRAALVDVVVRVGVLAAELGDGLAALDLNPVIVSSSGAVVADVLVEPHRPSL